MNARTFLQFGLLSSLLLVCGGCKDRNAIRVYQVAKETPAEGMPMPGSGATMPSPDATNPLPNWVVPAGWKSVPPSPMRMASFAIAGNGAGAGEVSVSTFPGDGGGDLANINRWRGQLGLAPLEPQGVKPLIVPVKGRDTTILTVRIEGVEKSTLAGWARIDGKSWFFKLTGPTPLVQGEQGRFRKFLESVQFRR